MFKIGVQGLGTQDLKSSRTLWEMGKEGVLEINGKGFFGRGCKISIGGKLTLGNNFAITGDTTIICSHQITFGDDCLLSWDNLIMDTDFHKIYDAQGNYINPSKPITIGNHVWIGCRNTILKGVIIADNTVIAAGSVITRSWKNPNCVIGGNTVKGLKENIKWYI